MALLKDYKVFAHVIEIVFGTGASGFGLAPRVQDKEGKRRIEQYNLIRMANLLNLDLKHYKRMPVYWMMQCIYFQIVKCILYHMHNNARSLYNRELLLMLLIKETLKYINNKAIQKLIEQVEKAITQMGILTVSELWNEWSQERQKVLIFFKFIIVFIAKQNNLKYMADDILLREAMHETKLERNSVVILDENHQRSLTQISYLNF